MLTSPYSSGLDFQPFDGSSYDGDGTTRKRATAPRRKRQPVTNPAELQFPAPNEPANPQLSASAPPVPTLDTTPNAPSVPAARGPISPTGMPPPPATGPVNTTVPPVHMGIETGGMSRLGKRLAQIEVLRHADPTASVSEQDWGWEEGPPNPHPSRRKQILMGLLQGALAGAAQTGSLAGAAGGAATGAVAGGVSPRLMMALKRQQDINYLGQGVEQDIGLQKGAATIGNIQAQTEENRAQALEAEAKAYLAQAGEYQDPDTGEIIHMTPEQAAALRQRDRAEKGRTQRGGRGGTNANVHYEQDETGTVGIYRDPKTGKLVSERVPGAPGKPATNSTQGAIAAEGQQAAAESDAARKPLQDEYDHYATQLTENEKTLQTKKEIFRKKLASPEVQSQLRRDKLLGYNTPMIDIDGEKFPLSVVSDDPDYKSGTLLQTVRNTQSIRKYLPEQQKKIDSVSKEGRGGRAKAARTGGKSSAASKPSATTHSFSIGAYRSRNPGATEADARAFAEQHYPGYTVVP